MEVVLTTMIDHGVAQTVAAKDLGLVALEANTHTRYSQRLGEEFLAREHLLEQVKTQVMDVNNR